MNSLQRSSLRGLRVFCVAARYESFRMAADELFITSSAVSHQIKSLEQELGMRLFERGKRELKLTDAGTSLYEDLGPLIDRIDGLVAEHRKSGRRKSIRMSVQPFFASEYFVPRLREFTNKHTNVDIQVGTSDEAPEKHPSDADLSIRLFKMPPADLRSDLLFPLRMVVAGSPGFKKTVVVEDGKIRSEFPIIIHQTSPKAWRDWSRSSGITLPAEAKITRLDSMIAVVRAAEQGIGAALVPVPLADLWFQQGSIVRLFDEEYISDFSYYLVSRDDRSSDDTVETLREWILKNFTRPR